MPHEYPKYKVAVVQLYPKPMSPASNFAKAETFIRSAAQQKCDLVVLPEYFLTNWRPKDPNFLRVCADSQKYLKSFQDLAAELNICIVPGTIVEVRDHVTEEIIAALPREERLSALNSETANNHLENVAYFIDNKGEIVGRYIKKNLWGPTERSHLASSTREDHQVFDTPLGKVGILVCWDMAFPEAFRELISQGAKIIIIPCFWTLSDCSDAGLKHNPSAEVVFVDSILTARAFENTCAILLANAGGPPGRGYMGLSQVTAPFIGPIGRLGSAAEGMLVADLDMSIMEDAEDNYNIRKDLAADDWHYDYRHTIKKKL